MKFSWRKYALPGAVLVALSASELAADTLYIGANVWRAKWNVGVADKNSENSLNQAPYTSFLTNSIARGVTGSSFNFTSFALNAPADANLTNFGLFGAYSFASVWSFSFNLTYGKTNFDSSRTTIYNTDSVDSTGSNDFRSIGDVVHRVEAERKDIDLILSRRLGDSGFALFGGLKGQDWDYSTPLTIGPTFRTGRFTDTASGSSGLGSSLGFAAFEYAYRSQALGPAAGLSYTHAIDDVQALTAQIGGIFLFGTLELNETNVSYLSQVDVFINPGLMGSGAPQATTTIDKTTDRLRMPGYTLRLDYRYKVGSVVLRAGVFYQETTLQSRAPNNEGLSLLSEIPIPVPLTPRSLQTQYSVDGARDIFKGFAISASTQIF
jgi:hypothetical protein